MHVLVLRGWLSSYGTEESKFLPFHGSQDLRYSNTALKREKRERREPISFSFLNIFSKLKKKRRKKVEAFVHELIRQWEWLGKEGRLTEVWRRSCPILPSWASVCYIFKLAVHMSVFSTGRKERACVSFILLTSNAHSF